MTSYRLAEIPPPPSSDRWADVLHWMVAVAQTDDPDLSFLASLLHHSIERPGLTERQSKYAQKIYNRFVAHWRAGTLDRQVEQLTSAQDLADLQPAGRA